MNLFGYIDKKYWVCGCCSKLCKRDIDKCPDCGMLGFYYVSTVYVGLLDFGSSVGRGYIQATQEKLEQINDKINHKAKQLLRRQR